MKTVTAIGVSLLLAVVVWTGMSWPLARHATSGIPASMYTDSEENVRAMIPGDHLQFLYHLWLGKDTFFGPTPLFYNLYEFNTGDDEERRYTQTYYLPFSLFFSLGNSFSTQAAGWNLTAIISLWCTALFTWLLTRRYTDHELFCWCAAAFSILLPYRWFALCGGSPTGLAMMWVPIIWWGVDLWVRDRNALGSLLAGVSIFLAGWSDSHVFFFGALSAPGWAVLAWLFHGSGWIPTWKEIRGYLISGIPLFLFAALVFAQAMMTKSGLEDTAIQGGRSLHEVALFSPELRGAISPRHGIDSEQLFLGWFPLAAIAGLCLWVGLRSIQGRCSPRKTTAFLLLVIGSTVAVFLAAGIHNPAGPRAWSILTRLIPPYGMIRQPAKIYVLIPVLLPMIAVFAAGCFPRQRRPNWLRAAVLLVTLGTALEYRQLLRPMISLLDEEQGAYKAVAEHARVEDRDPHLLALPIWPGDSHWNSVNQYYVSLYRIRMVNGYRPTARKTYVQDMYDPNEALNKGGFTAERLDDLLDRGVHYLVLHEDAFPEKVSPFSVSYTLQSILRHPRLQLLTQDGPVWSFQILDQETPEAVFDPGWTLHSSSRLWQGERAELAGAEVVADPQTSAGRFARLTAGQSLRTSPYPMIHAPSLRYLMRLRGSGDLSAGLPSLDTEHLPIRVESEDWFWHELNLPDFAGYLPLPLELTCQSGTVDFDVMVMATGDWPELQPGESLFLPASCLFHAGYTDLEKGHVVLRPRRDPSDVILYGPKLPQPQGRYSLALELETEADPGTLLGRLKRRYPGPSEGPTEVIAGKPAVFSYEQDRNIRLAFNFEFSGAAEISVRGATLTRIHSSDRVGR